MIKSSTPSVTLPRTRGREELAASLAIVAAVAALLLLAGLHILSPEFDPAWRVVSEYANGRYGWVLSVMFACWATSSWALAFAISPAVRTRAGGVGLGFLVVAGVGEAMAAVFDINQPLHELAGALGIGGLPVAAVLISVSLGRTQPRLGSRRALLWTANLTWVSLVAMAATFALLIATYVRAGGNMTAKVVTVLPPGVIGLVGWTNRLLVVAYCAWVITVAWQALQVRQG
jgi:Protein of unknown function (DUF998)